MSWVWSDRWGGVYFLLDICIGSTENMSQNPKATNQTKPKTKQNKNKNKNQTKRKPKTKQTKTPKQNKNKRNLTRNSYKNTDVSERRAPAPSTCGKINDTVVLSPSEVAEATA